MPTDIQFELLGLSQQELTSLLEAQGQPAFRGRQLHQALYSQRLDSLSALTTFPKSLRERLISDGYRITYPKVEQHFVSQDGTIRYLLGFADGQSVETVWMPDGDGAEDSDSSIAESVPAAAPNRRATICLSSQAGCAVSCQFCMTALLGLQRNLTPGEIVGQVLLLLKEHQVQIGVDRINLVFMGQGEPFLNYDNFLRAACRLVEAGIPESRMTVSTSGIVPRFAEFAAEPVRPRLAISLNASNDGLRDQIMPINRKWNLEALMDAARVFPLRPRERLTFEYVLLSGVNDTPENAQEVVALLRGLKAKVNLIALNPGPEIGFQTPTPEAVSAFQQTLIAAGIPAYLRRPRGRDIYAACGQLKRSTLVPLP
ncbi:MAG: 23S rRNA (adenine(2503)-C(2))-methyltransferase RlmN [Acidobacteriota bacterium]|nr:23S rRNA (adenine(2503)-C(2))-methyltransferase RlmN [Acidobacteriota bacterium]